MRWQKNDSLLCNRQINTDVLRKSLVALLHNWEKTILPWQAKQKIARHANLHYSNTCASGKSNLFSSKHSEIPISAHFQFNTPQKPQFIATYQYFPNESAHLSQYHGLTAPKLGFAASQLFGSLP